MRTTYSPWGRLGFTSLALVAMFVPAASGEPGDPRASNAAPRLELRTSPAANYALNPPLIEGPAPLTVVFNLCRSDDPDFVFLPDGTQDPRGDTLNWQFHFGDSGAPAFKSDGSFNPDAEHQCRVDHTYGEGDYVATVSVTDKHLEDQGRDVVGLARATTQVAIRVREYREEPAGVAACGTGAPCKVFVTSATYNGNLGGLAGADAKCQSLAAAANLAGTYKAWLSDATGSSPSNRFTHNPGPYVLVDGTTIAVDWADLTNGGILVPINMTESGATLTFPPAENVWTGTRPDGTRTVRFDGNPTGNPQNPNGQCSGSWNLSAFPALGSVGHSGLTGLLWSAGIVSRPCGFVEHLYCFQQQ